MKGTIAYKGFVWPNNPERMVYTTEEETDTALLPGNGSRVERIAAQPRQVSGEGFFYGPLAQARMNELEQVFFDKSPGTLFLPGRRPMQAYFTRLTVQEQVKKDTVGYQFVFLEDSKSALQAKSTPAATTVVRQGENLYHIAHRTGIAVEELADRNTLPGCFDLREGMQVRLK